MGLLLWLGLVLGIKLAFMIRGYDGLGRVRVKIRVGVRSGYTVNVMARV